MVNKDPYKLPEGNTLISVSGGRTSAFMLYEILCRYDGDLPYNCKVLFANTGREMDGTLDFVRDLEVHWNVPIVWLEYDRAPHEERKNGTASFKRVVWSDASRNGEPFDKYLSFNMLPNVFRRACTQELKVKTMRRYLLSIGWKQWNNLVGIRADEARRIKSSRDKRTVNVFPLAEAGITKQDVMQFWKGKPYDLKITPGSGNCDGCFLKSEATLAAMWREHPDRMEWWAAWEQRKSNTFHDVRTYKELGDFVDKQGDWIFDNEAFLCQADDGECTG